MAIEQIYSKEIFLDYPIDIVYKSIRDIKRVHKWNAVAYFKEEEADELECRYYTAIDGYEPQEHVYSFLVVSRDRIFIDDLDNGYPYVSYGLRAPNTPHYHTIQNNLKIELFKDVADPNTKTRLLLTRSVYLNGDAEYDTRVRTKQNKSTDLIINGLNQLVLDSDGLLSIPDKPDTPPSS